MTPPPPPARLFIGTAGWSVPGTSAASFPGPGTHLDRYARVLPCVEINSTFYRPHLPTTFARWASSVPEQFRFSVKAPKALTHVAKLACASSLLQAFLDQIAPLGAKLGPILFQLPPSLGFDPAVAESFFTSLRNLYSGPVVLEPRHPTWFTPAVNQLLEHLRIARVAADPALAPTANQPAGSPDLVYLRLHGSPRTYYSTYTPAQIATYAGMLTRPGPQQAWCIFDNTAAGAATANALELHGALSAQQPPEHSLA